MGKDEESNAQTSDASEGRPYTRRDFLKIAGVAGAALGAAGGLGGLLAACGGRADHDHYDRGRSTTTAAGPTTTAAAEHHHRQRRADRP